MAITIKDYRKTKELTSGYFLLCDNDGNHIPFSKLRKILIDNGYNVDKCLGSGSYGVVYKIKNKKQVVKITRDVAYVEYAKLSMRWHDKNPLFPKIHSIHMIDTFYVIVMDQYKSDTRAYYNSGFDDAYEYNLGWNFSILNDSLNLKEWVNVTRRTMNRFARKIDAYIDFDIHAGNVLFSGKNPVIIDPVCFS